MSGRRNAASLAAVREAWDGFVMALGICTWVGVLVAMIFLPSEGIRHCLETISLREMKMQPLEIRAVL
jgi:hypothetical protein